MRGLTQEIRHSSAPNVTVGSLIKRTATVEKLWVHKVLHELLRIRNKQEINFFVPKVCQEVLGVR